MCVCAVWKEIAAHMVLRTIMKKKKTNKPFEIGQRAHIVLLSLLLCVHYNTIIVYLSLSLSVSPISFRDLVFCFAIAKPVVAP